MTALTPTPTPIPTPITLRRLSGDLLVIHPTPSDSWARLAWNALPEEERPAHEDKIRILLDTEPATLWVDPPERRMYVDFLGFVRDMESGDEYAHGSVLLEEEGEPIYEEDFYYGYDPLVPRSEMLYHGRSVQFHRCWWQEGDTIEIPPTIQPVDMEHFLPEPWSEHQEEWEEKIAEWRQEWLGGPVPRYRAEQDDDQDQDQDAQE